MASSSDWIAAMERGAQQVGQGWLEQLPVAGTFVEGAPFAPSPEKPVEPEPPLAPNPAPDPTSDPVAEAFARGHEAGREAAASESRELGDQQRLLRLALRRFEQAGLDALAEDLSSTVIALCSQAIEGFAIDPAALLERCRECTNRLGSAAERCALHLHPADIALIDPASLAGWRVVEDEGIARGGLRLEGPDGSIADGPDEWRRAIAAAIRG